MTEYLIRLLYRNLNIAVLSRGYGRKTKGFHLVSAADNASESGDEPLQFKRKFKDITVAVSEKRVIGIEHLQDTHDAILLDDAFQHRAVKPGLSLLLFDFTRLHEFMLVLPAGNLREPFAGRKRADIIVITKTPVNLSAEDRKWAISHVRPYKNQQVFFSYLKYNDLLPLYAGAAMPLRDLPADTTVFLLTGIANAKPLLKEVASAGVQVRHYDYPDHHPFTRKNISKLAEDFNKDKTPKKIIITTEKDVQRLGSDDLIEILHDLPVFYLPIEAEFHYPDAERFNSIIEKYVKHL